MKTIKTTATLATVAFGGLAATQVHAAGMATPVQIAFAAQSGMAAQPVFLQQLERDLALLLRGNGGSSDGRNWRGKGGDSNGGNSNGGRSNGGNSNGGNSNGGNSNGGGSNGGDS